MIDLWENPGDYTSLMCHEMLPAIAKDLSLQCFWEYYGKVDAIFYEEKDTENFPRDSVYARYLSVALEHENIIGGTHVEMNKLQLFNTPLKVLITYAMPADHQCFLQRYSRIVQTADIFNDFASLRKQLVIIGSISSDRVLWNSYVYGCSGFTALA